MAGAGARYARRGDQAQAPDAPVVQEGHGDGRQAGAAGGHAEQHQRVQRGQEAGGGRCAAGAAAAGGGILSGGNTAVAGYHRPRAAERKLPEGDQCGSVRTPLKKCSLTADDGASSPMKWCMVAAGVVHWATMRGNYSGMPLRLRMVFSENPL